MRIRDAIWNDIYFGSMEEAVIRTPTFQKLHKVKQLGNSFQIYPSAVHTRLEHSLGVCHVAGVLSKEAGVPSEARKIIRLGGLLHDITHIPFAHTLSDQLDLIPDFKTKEEYSSRFSDVEDEVLKSDCKVINQSSKARLIELLNSEKLVKLSSGNADALKKPYKAEIIVGSFCADLLDYLLRDARFCGLKREYDDRIFEHATLLDQNGEKHFGLDITQSSALNNREISPSLITEYTHLLSIRYMLSERVYFYTPKVSIDALLSKAVRALIMEEDGKIDGKSIKARLHDFTNENFIERLADHHNQKVNYLGRRVKDRHLPRCALKLSREELSGVEKRKAVTYFRGRDKSILAKWSNIERKIAEEAGLTPEDIIIHTHDPEMSLKGSNALVRDDNNEVRRLDEWGEVTDEVQDLQNSHKALWRLYVFSGDRTEEKLQRVSSVAKRIIKPTLRGS